MPVTTRSQAKVQTPQPSTSTAAPAQQNPKKKMKLCPTTLLSIYPTQTNDGNPLDNYRILKQMAHLASKADLAKLNGINANYYVCLQSDHLDAFGERTLVIKPSPYTRSIVKDGPKWILAEDWNSGLAKFYNKLEMDSLFFLGPVPDYISESLRLKLPFANSIVEDVCEYITTLQLNRVGHIEQPFYVIQTGAMIVGFLNKFPNLMKLKLGFYNDILKFSQAELESLLFRITLRSNVQITVKINDDSRDDWLENQQSIELDRLMRLFPNIKLDLGFKCCDSDQKLQDITSIYFRYATSIEGIGLNFYLSTHTAYFLTNQSVTSRLTQLSPIVNYLSVQLHLDDATENWNVLEEDKNWPNLRSLKIDRYNRPLDILKHCPQLEKLELRLDETRCIFHNPNQTAQEDIVEYFGNLPQLKELTFGPPSRSYAYGSKWRCPFITGQPLYVFLKTLLPKGVIININRS